MSRQTDPRHTDSESSSSIGGIVPRQTDKVQTDRLYFKTLNNPHLLLIGGPPKWGDREIDRLVQNTVENGLYRDLC